MCWVILHSVHNDSKEATFRRLSRSLSIPYYFMITSKILAYIYVCVFIYEIKHMLWGVWQFTMWKKLQEIYMNRISLFQRPHLIRARVEFCTYINKKSIFLLDFSSKSLKRDLRLICYLVFVCPFIYSQKHIGPI